MPTCSKVGPHVINIGYYWYYSFEQVIAPVFPPLFAPLGVVLSRLASLCVAVALSCLALPCPCPWPPPTNIVSYRNIGIVLLGHNSTHTVRSRQIQMIAKQHKCNSIRLSRVEYLAVACQDY